MTSLNSPDSTTNRKPLLIVGGLIGVAVVAYLAFGFFGIQAAFTDDEVNEAGPIFASQREAADPAGSSESADTTESAESAESSDGGTDEMSDDSDEMSGDGSESAAATGSSSEPEVTRLVEGGFIDRAHGGEGTAVVLTDGAQRFLRFEDDFAIDNGPDLEVYLVADVDADGEEGLFDDDFVSLGDLKGNIGSQNYEIPADVDLDRYDTVVIWCVRFTVAFNAADLR